MNFEIFLQFIEWKNFTLYREVNCDATNFSAKVNTESQIT